jgi:hypothetical protein
MSSEISQYWRCGALDTKVAGVAVARDTASCTTCEVVEDAVKLAKKLFNVAKPGLCV